MEAHENRGFDRIGQQITQAQAQVQPAPAAARRAPRARPRHRRGRRRRRPPPAPGPTSSVADRIAELHRLHTQGAITDAEFEAKKAQLLEQF